MILISACVVGFLAGVGIGFIVMSALTAGSRAEAWADGYKSGALAEREVTNVFAPAVERLRQQQQRASCGSFEDR